MIILLQKKLKIELPYNPAIPLLGIYSKEIKSLPRRNFYIIEVLFTLTKKWKSNLGVLLTTEWTKKSGLLLVAYVFNPRMWKAETGKSL